jgi:hypothetical protein
MNAELARMTRSKGEIELPAVHLESATKWADIGSTCVR